MSDCYESMSRTPIRDRFPPLIADIRAPHAVIPAIECLPRTPIRGQESIRGGLGQDRRQPYAREFRLLNTLPR